MTIVTEVNTTAAERADLAARVEHIGKEAADLVRNPDAQVTRLATPFFRDGAVYRVIYNGRYHPIAFSVGTAERHYAIMLPLSPGGFFELAAKAGVSLDTPDSRVSYAEVFLESTRDFRRRFQIIKNASEIELLPNATPEQKKRYEALVDKYEPLIRAPRASSLSSGEIVLYALVGESLFEIRLKISGEGKIVRSDTVLERDLPITTAK